jgi:large subunit ribosomal protein L3
MKIGLLGKKIGMTRVYDSAGKATAATVIVAGGNSQTQLKTVAGEGYSAVQVGFDTQKPQRLSKALVGHFKKAGAEPKRVVREFRIDGTATVDASLDLSVSQFAPGDVIDVIGRSKGKGFQGVVRKHGMAGQPASHGSMMHRRNGAIGNRSTPGRIWKNMGMPGHMGDERVTVQNLKVLQVRAEEGVILVTGAVPGANGSFVVVRPAKKAKKTEVTK